MRPTLRYEGVPIKGSGRDLQAMDFGIFLEKTAERALIENNRLEGNLFGIYVHGAAGSRVVRNIVEGLRSGRLNEAGNGVSLWNAPDVTIADNTFRYGRDGIFTITSRKDRFANNRFEHVRFAVHYMYTNDSEVSGNVSVGNHVGYAIMYSNRLMHPRQYLATATATTACCSTTPITLRSTATGWPAVRSIASPAIATKARTKIAA